MSFEHDDTGRGKIFAESYFHALVVDLSHT